MVLRPPGGPPHQRSGPVSGKAVSGLRKEIHRAVIPVKAGIHTGGFMATTALDSGSHPTGLAWNDDERIAETTLN